MDPSIILLPVMMCWLVLFAANQRFASPLISIVSRWIFWIIVSLGGALICMRFGLINRPYWAVAGMLALGWILVGTLYNWLAIKALSLSPLPLFPRFVLNSGGDEWPTNPRLLRVRDWLRSNDFKQVQALRAEVAPSIYLRMSIYHDAQNEVRAQVTFVPHAGGSLSLCLSFATETTEGLRYVTDNLYLPYGGFYPEDWLVERVPWRRSPARLLNRHRQRLAAGNAIIVPWATEPLSDLNQQQLDLERVNIELGFLHQHAEREEHGKITPEGRYRVWKEYWLLNYLGRSSRYI